MHHVPSSALRLWGAVGGQGESCISPLLLLLSAGLTRLARASLVLTVACPPTPRRCSEESAAPCSLPRYGASTTQQPPATVQPGTCLLSGELVKDLSDLSTSFSFMWGDSVEWSSGGTLTPPSVSAPQTQVRWAGASGLSAACCSSCMHEEAGSSRTCSQTAKFF
jgi:hypothetical protein